MVFFMYWKALAKRVGNNIKKYRQLAGLTQEEAAEKAQGMSLRYWQYLERGEKNFTLNTIAHVSRVLNVKMEELFR